MEIDELPKSILVGNGPAGLFQYQRNLYDIASAEILRAIVTRNQRMQQLHG